MRISLLNGTTLYPLAGQSGVSERVHSSAGDLRINGQVETQIVNRVRATHGLMLDRGNLLQTLSFTTMRKFATAEECQRFANDYDATFARTGTLVIEGITPSGEVSIRLLVDAVVAPPERRPIGSSLAMSYTVTGSSITTVEEFPDPAILWNEDDENWED